MPTGNSRPASTRTTSPRPCSPRSKEDFYSPRCNGVPARSKLRSTPFSRLPSADEPKPDSSTAIAEVGSRLFDDARASTRCACGPAAVRDAGHLVALNGLLRSGIPSAHSANLTARRVGDTFHLDLDGTAIAGHHIEVDPPHRMLLRWDRQGTDPATPTHTFIEIALTPTGDGTNVRVQFSGLSAEDAVFYAQLWARHLDR